MMIKIGDIKRSELNSPIMREQLFNGAKKKKMTFQEIHERICVNRSNLISTSDGAVIIKVDEVLRKINEIEWALQVMAERLAQKESP
jgi:hypothetical protein